MTLRRPLTRRLSRPTAVLLLAAALAPITLVPAAADAQRFRLPDTELSMAGSGMRGAFKPVVAGGANAATVRIKVGAKEVALGTVVSADGYVLTKASELVPAPPTPPGERPDGEARGGRFGGPGRRADRPATAPVTPPPAAPPGPVPDPVVVLRDGTVKPATVVGVAEDHDLALLKIDAAGLTPIRWAGPAAPPVVGQWVVTPGMADVPAAVGVLSVGRRKIPPKSGMIGVRLADVGDGGGAKIDQVVTNSPAERAGLKVGDVIAAVNGKAVGDHRQLMELVRGLEPGAEVRLAVRRGDETLDVKATLASGLGPAARAEMMNAMGGVPSRRNANFPAVLQHDTVLTPSLCGGPLVGLDGAAIGVNIARAGRVESFAVPADVVVKLLPDLKSGKLAPKRADRPTTKPAERKNED